MAESDAGSWAQLGGIEIVNDARTTAYLLNGLRPPSLNVRGNCGCENIRELVGCDGPYTDPATDNAPWYSPDIPESANFAGFLVTEFEGMGSTFTRSVTESIIDGGVLGRGRRGSRSLTWRGLLLGADCCAVAYGLRWLSKTLSAGTRCRDCSGDDLDILVCCPDEEAVSGGVDPFRLLKNVALVSGPEIIQNHKLGCSCGASCITEIEFTLVAAQPFFYSTPIPIYDCVGLVDGAADPVTNDEPCPVVDCGELVLSQLCPPPDLPPLASYINPCFTGGGPYKAVYFTVPRSSWPFASEVVPVISITTGTLPLIDIEIGFYSSSDDNPCGDLLTFPPLCDAVCDDLRILAINSNSTFYIDGRSRKMALICGPTSVFPGEPYTQGPWSWPVFDDFGFCMEFKYKDPSVTGYSVEDVCVSLTLVPRTI